MRISFPAHDSSSAFNDELPIGPLRPARRRYSLAEVWADGVVHAAGLTLVAVGSIAMLASARGASDAALAAAATYLISLALCFSASAAFNLWPTSRAKWILRRLDQSAIYLLIAGTYTPFLAAIDAWRPLAAIWAVACFGIALRLWRPSKYDRLSLALYLLLGWSGALMFGEVVAKLPAGVASLIATGGVVYSLGVIFHVWNGLKFQNAIWHLFVLTAATFHFMAVWSTVVTG